MRLLSVSRTPADCLCLLRSNGFYIPAYVAGKESPPVPAPEGDEEEVGLAVGLKESVRLGAAAGGARALDPLGKGALAVADNDKAEEDHGTPRDEGTQGQRDGGAKRHRDEGDVKV
jgi:hypothetical protein